MPAMEPLCKLLDIDPKMLAKDENQLLELILYSHIYEGLIEIYRRKNLGYFQFEKFNIEMENKMLYENLARLIINDILLTNDYNLTGISHYTDTHEDILHDIYYGFNRNPSATFLRKLIELHMSVNRDLYLNLINKVKNLLLN